MGDACGDGRGFFFAHGEWWVYTCGGEMPFSAAMQWFWPAWFKVGDYRETAHNDGPDWMLHVAAWMLLINVGVVLGVAAFVFESWRRGVSRWWHRPLWRALGTGSSPDE